MSSEASRVLSAFVIAVAIVVAANMMAEPRYQSFAEENAQNQTIRGVFDTHTGRVCYAVVIRTPSDAEGESSELLRCAPTP